MFRVNTAYTTKEHSRTKMPEATTISLLHPSLRYKINDVLDINLEYEGFETEPFPGTELFFIFLLLWGKT